MHGAMVRTFKTFKFGNEFTLCHCFTIKIPHCKFEMQVVQSLKAFSDFIYYLEIFTSELCPVNQVSE